jgi:hypothetical protein
MDLKTILNRLFDKDLDLNSKQRRLLVRIIGALARHEFKAGLQAAKELKKNLDF